jgi:hypothetical protein
LGKTLKEEEGDKEREGGTYYCILKIERDTWKG